MTFVYILGVVAVLAVAYFAFFRKKPAELPPAESAKGKLPEAKPTVKESARLPAPEAKPPPKAKPKAEDKRPAAVPVEEEVPVEAEAPAVEARPKASPTPPAKKDVAGLRKGLAATRGGFIARLKSLFTGHKEIDPSILEELEEVMLSSDVGVKTTQTILARLRERLEKHELGDEDAVWAALREEATEILSIGGGGVHPSGKPTVVLMVGVNGVGKTTTIGKLATRAKDVGQKAVLAAGDTFRAGAVHQLELWGNRVGAEVVKGKEGGDPGAVAFEATNKAKELGADLLFVDTAGRLHTKTPLMDEIKKVRRTIGKALEGAPHETLLVLDATTGQNALTQASMFKEAVDLTGIVLTKLDGTAKGGIVLGICDELKVPVRYIGLGERAEDLREFNPEEFVEALFGQPEEAPPSSS